MEHELKTWPPFFQAIEDGRKTFEVRRNDRGFNAGDVLHLREFDPSKVCTVREYTGNQMRVKVTYVLSGEQLGIKDGFCVMGIRFLTDEDEE
jgi:ASC-1-like (ASCH) protein